MVDTPTAHYTTFAGHRLIASGALQKNALAARYAVDTSPSVNVLIFDDLTGRTIDVDMRGTDEDIMARYAPAPTDATGSADQAGRADASPKGRGRPKLGVVPREVTLLPRHWEWLSGQPGGASVMLRKLVDDARRAGIETGNRRQSQERAYHFMQAIGGDLPGFEEATRALFADDAGRLGELLARWPDDVRAHAMRLAFGGAQSEPSSAGA
jgi:hypothetical protein